MRFSLLFLLIIGIVQLSVAPPVEQKRKDEEQSNENEVEDDKDMGDIMEYRRYLTEVVQVLESDPEFREKLSKVDEADIRTGKIAEELQFVNHNIRTRLDEIKREELERLRHLATKMNELENGLDTEYMKIPEHLDHTNTRTFEIQDLKKLIAKTTQDLAKADRRRREEFKQHEMQKQFEEEEKLKQMNEEERKKYEQELKATKDKQKKHEPIHHPGSKQQLEEVWQVQDHMTGEDFNPRTFFYFHDVDGNGVWDQDEVKALFVKELDKLYAQGAPQSDLFKRAEEMERMREHVFNEADLNKDGLLSYEEFLEQTKKPDFQQDEEWQGLDEQQIYTQEEFEAFARHKQEEMIRKGMLPEHPSNAPAPHEPFPPHYGHVPAAPGAAPGDVPYHPDTRGSNQQNLPHQQFQNQQQYYQQHPQVVSHQYTNNVPVQQTHEQILQQPQQGQIPLNHQYQPMQGQAPVQHQQMPPVQHQQMPPVQHQQMPPVQHQQMPPVQHQQMPPVHQQIPLQQHQPPQPSNFQQNSVNQAAQNVQNNAVPQHNDPNQLNSQPVQAQQDAQYKISAAGKT